MDDFSPTIMFVIAQETFGFLFWPLLVLGAIGLVLFLGALFTGKLGATSFRPPLLIGLVLGILAMVIAPLFTGAGFGDLSEMVDFVALLVLGVLVTLAAWLVIWSITALVRSGYDAEAA